MSSEGLSFQTEIHEGCAVVSCSGRLMAGETDPLRAEIRALFPQAKKVVLDLSGLTSMDSMGLGTIVALYVSSKAAGCELVIVNFGERVRKLLIMTNLLSVFEEYGNYNLKMP